MRHFRYNTVYIQLYSRGDIVPKKSEQILDKLIQGRCTSKEYDNFAKKAEMEGLKVSQAIRELVIEYVESDKLLNPSSKKMSVIEKKIKELEEGQKQMKEALAANLGELAA